MSSQENVHATVEWPLYIDSRDWMPWALRFLRLFSYVASGVPRNTSDGSQMEDECAQTHSPRIPDNKIPASRIKRLYLHEVGRQSGRWHLYQGQVVIITRSLQTTSFLSATTNFNHEPELPTAETSKRCSLLVGCGHRGHESREGDLEHDTSQSRVWFRRYSSNDDQGTSPPVL